MRIFSGVRQGSMASFSCSVSRSRRRPSRATCLHEAGGQRSRGAPFFAIKPLRFGQYFEDRSNGYARLYVASYSDDLMQFPAAQIATGRQQPTLNAGRVNLRSSQDDRGVTHSARRVACVPGDSRRALEDRPGTALPIRSQPHGAWAPPCFGRAPLKASR
jgi:hypothetical protein